MSQNPYQTSNVDYGAMVQNAEASVRSSFIRSTYLHLFGAILLCVLIDTAIFTFFYDQLEPVVQKLSQGWNMILFLVAFMVVTGMADTWARNGATKALQYAGLGVCVLAYAVFFVPMLFLANEYAPGAIESAGVVTLVVFGGLTATVFVTKADFSFLRMFLAVIGFSAMGLIVLAFLFGLQLGNWFSIAMIVLASGYILYETSNIQRRYRTDQSVAAAAALFASVGMLFFYVLRLFMMSRD